MSIKDFQEIKLSTCQRFLEIIKSELSASKEKERILQKKLDNATETIRCLNKKLKKKHECSYCYNGSLIHHQTKNNTARIETYIEPDDSFIVCIDHGKPKADYARIHFNFCPMCGRRLNKDAQSDFPK